MSPEDRLAAIVTALAAFGGKVGQGKHAMTVRTNSLGMRFAWIPPGTFLMGSPTYEVGRDDDETQHPVILTQGFFLGVHQVTQAQWEAIMGDNPSQFKGAQLPVEFMWWADCIQFCNKLSKRHGTNYRLPTEAEWEYACRAGSTGAYCFGNDPEELNKYAWRGRNALKQPHPVGEKKPNAWGLHDMHGNVSEWCSDWYDVYPTEEINDPQGPATGEAHVLRGGAWDSGARRCRSANRYSVAGRSNFGLRVCFRLD